eukprot:scaffold74990_cov17-Prasinocladus_malaysianus.AAC.1
MDGVGLNSDSEGNDVSMLATINRERRVVIKRSNPNVVTRILRHGLRLLLVPFLPSLFQRAASGGAGAITGRVSSASGIRHTLRTVRYEYSYQMPS